MYNPIFQQSTQLNWQSVNRLIPSFRLPYTAPITAVISLKISPIISLIIGTTKEEEDTNFLVDWQLQKEVQILVVIFLVSIIIVIGFLNRKIKNVLLFALSLSGFIIALFFAMLK